MNNGNDLAFPELSRSVTGLGSDGQQHSDHFSSGGLTKREYAAIKAMQGILATETADDSYDRHTVAKRSVAFADALLAALSPAATGASHG